MFSCLQILEAFLWFVLITLLNVTLIILTLSVSRLLNLLLRLVAFLLFLNPQCLASISRWITASSSWKRFCLYVCRSFFFFNDTATTEIYTLSLHDALPICGHGGPEQGREQLVRLLNLLDHRSEEHTSELPSPCNLVCRLLLEKKKNNLPGFAPLSKKKTHQHILNNA